MNRKKIISRIILWASVLITGILIGGGIFEHTVLSPLWQGSPPESVREWPYGTVQARFFIVVSPAYYLCSIALLIASFWMPLRIRMWVRVAGVIGLIVGIMTFGFFIPILNQTQATGGAGLSGDEITALVNSFKSWNYLRFALLITGWIAVLRAFSVSSNEASEESAAFD